MPDNDVFPRLRAWSERAAVFDGSCHCRGGDICDNWNQLDLGMLEDRIRLFWSHLIATCVEDVLRDLDAAAAEECREQIAAEVPHLPRCVKCDADEDGDFLYWPKILGTDYPPGPEADPEAPIVAGTVAGAVEENECFWHELAAWLQGIGREDVKDALCKALRAKLAAWRGEPWGLILPEDPC